MPMENGIDGIGIVSQTMMGKKNMYLRKKGMCKKNICETHCMELHHDILLHLHY